MQNRCILSCMQNMRMKLRFLPDIASFPVSAKTSDGSAANAKPQTSDDPSKDSVFLVGAEQLQVALLAFDHTVCLRTCDQPFRPQMMRADLIHLV